MFATLQDSIGFGQQVSVNPASPWDRIHDEATETFVPRISVASDNLYMMIGWYGCIMENVDKTNL